MLLFEAVPHRPWHGQRVGEGETLLRPAIKLRPSVKLRPSEQLLGLLLVELPAVGRTPSQGRAVLGRAVARNPSAHLYPRFGR